MSNTTHEHTLMNQPILQSGTMDGHHQRVGWGWRSSSSSSRWHRSLHFYSDHLLSTRPSLLNVRLRAGEFLPFSMKSMTANEWLCKLLQPPPSWLEESFGASCRRSEPSPSLPFFDLLLFFFEDILIMKNFFTWTWKRVNRARTVNFLVDA